MDLLFDLDQRGTLLLLTLLGGCQEEDFLFVIYPTFKIEQRFFTLLSQFIKM